MSRDIEEIGNRLRRRESGVRAVMFDAVGTLIRPTQSVAEIYHRVAVHFGCQLTVEQVDVRFREQLRQLVSEQPSPAGQSAVGPSAGRPEFESEKAEYLRWQRIVFGTFAGTGTQIDPVFQRLWHHFGQAKHWRLYDDTLHAWQRLQDTGLLIGIASNFDLRLRRICQGLPPLNTCEHVFLSSRIGFAKPAREFFEFIQRKLNLEPHELVVGDDPVNDLLGAKQAGWQVALIDRPTTTLDNAICDLIRNVDQN